MLKITKSTVSAVNLKEIESKVGGNSVVGKSVIGCGEAINQISSTNQAKITKSKIFINNKSVKTGPGFLTFGARLVFTQLRQAFVETLILHHFDPEYNISIETDASSYAIGGHLSQLALDDFGHWYPVTLFS